MVLEEETATQTGGNGVSYRQQHSQVVMVLAEETATQPGGNGVN